MDEDACGLLEQEAAALAGSPSAEIAFSNNYYITPDGRRTGTWADGETPPQGDVFRATFARGFPRLSLFRMETVSYAAWKRVGFHDPGLALYEDFDMRIRLTKRCRVVYRDEPLTEIRLHGTGLSQAPAACHLEALTYILEKNARLLDDLPTVEARGAQRDLCEWIAPFARRAALDEAASGRRLRALAYGVLSFRLARKLDLDLVRQIWSPRVAAS